MWFDEAFSWRITQFPFGEMLERVGQDNHPPLYFILLKAWTAVFGTSAIALRGLSVLFAALTIVAVYLFVTEAFLPDPDDVASGEPRPSVQSLGLVAASLTAVSVFQIRWSWEARMYTLATALAVLSSWLLFRALRSRESSARQWALYGVAALLFAYTHYYAIFSLAAQALFLLGYLGWEGRGSAREFLSRKRTWHAVLALNILVVGWLPWLPTFLAQHLQVRTAYWSRPVERWDIPFACYQMFLDPEDATLDRTDATVVAIVCVAILVSLLWRPHAGEWFVFCAVAIPIAMSAACSLVGTNVFHLRYLLYAHVFLLIAIARLVWRISSPIERNLVCGVLLAAFLVVDVMFWQKLDIASKPGARAAVTWIESQRKAGEPVFVCSPLVFYSTLYHAGDRAAGWHLYTNGSAILHYEGSAIVRPEDLMASAELRDVKESRAWIIDMEGGAWGQRVVPVPLGWQREDMKRFPEVYGVQGQLVVSQYRVPPGG